MAEQTEVLALTLVKQAPRDRGDRAFKGKNLPVRPSRGKPSKNVRKAEAKLAARNRGFEEVPTTLRSGFKRPGSRNK